MSRIYARKLTKEELIKYGVKEITKDCKVIFEDGRVLEKEEDFKRNKNGYLSFYVYDLDENGNRIKIPAKRRYKEKIYNINSYKRRAIGIYRAMIAWFNNEVPEGIDIDHINNKHETLYDNRLENLQPLTHRENTIKDKPLSTRELRCRMTLPLSYYEEKLITFINKYNDSKDQKEKNLLSTQIWQYKARIRYWKSHEEEYIKNKETEALKADALKDKEAQKELINSIEAKARKAQKERTKELKQYKKLVDEARELYKQDPSSDNCYNWKLAVANYNYYLKTHPYKTQKQLFAELDCEQLRN